MRQKFRISFNDFMPNFKKFPIGAKDKNGVELHLGDVVVDESGDKHYVGYRYGEYMLKQPHTMHSLMVKDYSRYEVINEFWGVMDEWVIIGYTDEPLYDLIKEVPDVELI